MSYEFYKLVHITGVFMILMPLAAITFHVLRGGVRAHPGKRALAIFHGLGMLLVFVAGFGLKQRLGIEDWPTWLVVKLVVWLALGSMIGLIYRMKSTARFSYWLILGLAALSTYLAVFKP